MATLRSMVSEVRSMFKLISSDDTISDRAIAAELISTSIELIKRETDKRKLFSSDNIFTEISCLQMKEVPLSECCDYVSDCKIARSVDKVPRIGENIYGLLLQGVFTTDARSKKFDYVDIGRYINILDLYPNSRDKHKYFWKSNGYIYVTDPNIEEIKLIAFFEEFVDKTKYGCGCEDNNCPDNPLDLEFKCPGYLYGPVLRMVRDTMLKTYKQSQPDKQEDDKDDSK